jgi:DNA-binding NarL/FixJ family response regulator
VLGAGVAPIVIGRATSHVQASRRIPGLTDREDDVLHLLSQGMGNREIAGRLFLSEKTVRNYVSGLLTKLHVQDRAAAVAAARDAGYGSARR